MEECDEDIREVADNFRKLTGLEPKVYVTLMSPEFF